MAFTVLSLWSTAVFAQSWSSDVLIAKKGVKQSTMPDSTAQLRNEKVSVFMKTLNEKYGAQ
ncbi:MAG: hypothetical protein RR388_08115, partial [Rikenellaceae bacterium]